MEYNIGFIKSYEGGVGTVLDQNDTEYLFTEECLVDKDIKINDTVSFRSEVTKLGTYKAFFIEKIKEEKNNE